ncbi:MAG: outer membrane beta-barrel protein, partial [Gammaproteobacteria bacterium]
MRESPLACGPKPNVRAARLRKLPFVAAAVGLVGLPVAARAQYVPSLFPAGVPGYGEELGVTVVSRVHPLYEEPGVRVGGFTVHLNLDESGGYNSNVLGLNGAEGSSVVQTSPSLAINSDWSRNALGARFGVDNFQYPALSAQNRTNWTAAIGGGYTIGRNNLTVGYAHLALHESATDIGAPPSTTPIPYTVDDMRTAYPIEFGALKITPNFEASLWRYGNTVI